MKKDDLCKNYLKKKEIFADAFNFYLYDGKQVIKPDDLTELDTNEVAKLKNNVSFQKNRDVFKQVTIMQNDEKCYMLLGIESQSYIDYGMVVRCMLYDAISYYNQIKELENKLKNVKIKTGNEFLSKMGKAARLKPVVTLVIYFGDDEWDGVRTLHDILEDSSNEIEELIPNYKLHLISPYEIEEKRFEKFSTELYNVLKFIKYSKNEEKLYELKNDDRWKVDRDTYDLINVLTELDLEFEEDGGTINMCKGIEDLKRHAEERGEKRGEERGREEGIILEREDNVYKLYCKGISKEEISNLLDLSLDDVNRIIVSKSN